jgi:hypothetical protein
MVGERGNAKFNNGSGVQVFYRFFVKYSCASQLETEIDEEVGSFAVGSN